ncbi:hypothetical protein [Kribbella lupini]|uniref:hypothetical protein n=1 Tax=Kribbella lupini TaxID=291602 RepID=UPI0031CE97BC
MLKTEYTYSGSRVRADMRTVDRHDVLRLWEFKIHGNYAGLGQALTYLALAREELGFDRVVRGVLAAFDIQPEVRRAVEILNLGIELVIIPEKLRLAGGVPGIAAPVAVPQIPQLPNFFQSDAEEI